MLLWAVPALATFALFNLLLNRAILAWLSRWLAQRRTREILGVVFILATLSLQMIGPMARRYGEHAWAVASRFALAGRILPPTLAAHAITMGHAGHAGSALALFAGLLAYCAALGWLLSIRLRAEYRGENLSEARRESPAERSTVSAGWNLTGLSPTVAALLEKDLRYLIRNSQAYLTLLTPVFIVIVLSLSQSGAHTKKPIFLRSSSIFFPLSIFYVMLPLLGQAYNSLGYDGGGVAMLLAAPIRFRDVLVAKNLLQSLLVVAEVAAVSVLSQFIVGPAPALIVGLTMAGALVFLLTNLAAGNLVSLYFPRKLIPGQMRRQKASGLAAMASLGTQVILAALIAGLYFLARWTGHLGWCGVAFLLLAGIAWMGYCHVLDMVSDIAWKRREVIMTELSRSS